MFIIIKTKKTKKMACSIGYIDDYIASLPAGVAFAGGVTDLASLKDEMYNYHNDIVNDIMTQNDVDNFEYKESATGLGYLFLSKRKSKSGFSLEQRQSNILKRHPSFGSAFDIKSMVLLDGTSRKAISINVIPVIESNFISSSLVGVPVVLPSADNKFDMSWANDVSPTVSSFAEKEVNARSDVFRESIDTIKIKIEDFINKNKGNPEFVDQIKELKELLNILKNPDSISVYSSVMKSIEVGLNIFKKIQKEANEIPALITQMNILLSDPSTKAEGIKISKQVSGLLNGANSVSEILQFLQEYGDVLNEKTTDYLFTYNKYLLYQDLNNTYGISSAAFKSLYESSSSIFEFKYYLSKNFGISIADIEATLKDAEYDSAQESYWQEFQGLSSSVSALQDFHKKMTYEYLTDLLYPELLNAYQEDDITGNASSTGKYKFMSRNEFKASLILGKEDISIFNKWLGSGLTYNDNFARTVALLVNDQYENGRIDEIDFSNRSIANFTALGLTKKRKAEIEKTLIVEKLYIDNCKGYVEITAAERAAGIPFIDITDLKGVTRSYVARVQKHLVTDYDTIEYEVLMNYLSADSERVAEEIMIDIKTLIRGSTHIEDIYNFLSAKYLPFGTANIEIEKLFDTIFIKDPLGIYVDFSSVFDNKSENEREYYIQTLLYAFSSSKFTSPDSQLSIADKMQKNGIASTAELISILNSDSKRVKDEYKYFVKNTNKKSSFWLMFNMFNIDKETILMEDIGGIYEVPVIINGVAQVLTITNAEFLDPNFVSNMNASYDNVEFFTKKADFMKYKDILNNRINGTVEEKSVLAEIDNVTTDTSRYFNYLKDIYDETNLALGFQGLKHYQLANIPKADTASFYNAIKGVKGAADVKNLAVDFFKHLAEEYVLVSESGSYMYLTNDKGEYVDRNGNVVSEVDRVEESTQNKGNNKMSAKRVMPKYIKPIQSQNVETDLFISMNLFAASSSKFKSLKDIESSMHSVKRVLNGDVQFGIEARELGNQKKNNLTDTLLSLDGIKNIVNKVAVVDEARVTEAINAYIDFFVYEDKDLIKSKKGVDINKVSKLLKGLNAYQVLAVNLISPVTNLTIGATNNRLLTIGNKHGLSAEAMNFARLEYAKGVANGDYFMDYFEDSLSNISKVSQLAAINDMMKGDGVNTRKIFGAKKDLKDKVFDKKHLYITTTMPEHALQLTLGIAVMKDFVVGLDAAGNNVYYYDIVRHSKGNPVTIDISSVVTPTFNIGINATTPTLVIERQLQKEIKLKIEALARIAHGAYAQSDKAMIERHAVFSLAYQYSRWMYPFFKSRFGSKDFDVRLHQNLERGFYREFYKNQLTDIIQHEDDEWLFSPSVLGVGKAAAKIVSKSAMAMLNYWTGIDKGSVAFDEFLNGAKDAEYEIRRTAHLKYGFELSLHLLAMMIALGVRVLLDDDDDDDKEDTKKKWMLRFLEIQAQRYMKDIGVSNIFFSPEYALDTAVSKVTDPFMLKREATGLVELWQQLTGYETRIEDDGSFGINYSIDDRYSKSGNGFEKGDLKVSKKLYKTIFSPLHQINRFLRMDNEQQYFATSKSSGLETDAKEVKLEKFAESKENN